MTLPAKVLPVVLAFGLTGCATGPSGVDYLAMPPLGAGWKVARSQEERNVRSMTTFVRQGETLDNWTELINWQSFRKERTVSSDTLLNIKGKIYGRCVPA